MIQQHAVRITTGAEVIIPIPAEQVGYFDDGKPYWKSRGIEESIYVDFLQMESEEVGGGDGGDIQEVIILNANVPFSEFAQQEGTDLTDTWEIRDAIDKYLDANPPTKPDVFVGVAFLNREPFCVGDTFTNRNKCVQYCIDRTQEWKDLGKQGFIWEVLSSTFHKD